MSTSVDGTEDSIGTQLRYAPRAFSLGFDAEGNEHVCTGRDGHVHVIDRQTGERERREWLENRPVADWMDWVERCRGWERRLYGAGIVPPAVRELFE